MSQPFVHVLQGVAVAGGLYPLVGTPALVAGAATILIDVDHVILYAWDTRSLNPIGFFKYFDILVKQSHKRILGISHFHMLEVYALMAWLGFAVHPYFHWALGGFIFHHIFDQISLARAGFLWVRVYSYVEWFIRVRNPTYVTRLKDILRINPLSPEDERKYAKWLRAWGVTPAESRPTFSEAAGSPGG